MRKTREKKGERRGEKRGDRREEERGERREERRGERRRERERDPYLMKLSSSTTLGTSLNSMDTPSLPKSG